MFPKTFYFSISISIFDRQMFFSIFFVLKNIKIFKRELQIETYFIMFNPLWEKVFKKYNNNFW